MTGEDRKGVGGTTGEAKTTTTVIDSNNSINRQNGAPEKAPVVPGTNVETLPRQGKQVNIFKTKSQIP